MTRIATSMKSFTIAIGVACTLAAPRAGAQPAPSPPTPLEAGLELYAAAAYEEALAAFERARADGVTPDAAVTLEVHQMLCLLALGRSAAAEVVATRVFEAKPNFTLGPSEASPRVRTLVDETRRRVLPGLSRRLYADARRAYDAGEYALAADVFGRLRDLFAASDTEAVDAALADFKTLTEGFLTLSHHHLTTKPAAAAQAKPARPQPRWYPAQPMRRPLP